jgi:DUF3047 family protein
MRRVSARLYRLALTPCLIALVAVHAHATGAPAHAQAIDAAFEPPRFSSMHAHGSLAPWTSVPIAFGKKPTHYDLVADGANVVLHAVADNAASGLGVALRADLAATPVLAWRWKIAGLVPGADPHKAAREDAPARIVLEFDGDVGKLPILERGIYGIAEHFAGRALPYATLMYVWTSEGSIGSVIPNPRTRRIEMIVVESGDAGAGEWRNEARDVRADFRRAFGEEPGPLSAIGVLTDSDNTHSHAEAWYGDLHFEPAH